MMIPRVISESPMFVTVTICDTLVEFTDTLPKCTSYVDTIIPGSVLGPFKGKLSGFSSTMFAAIAEVPEGKIILVKITNESKPFNKNPFILYLLNW